MKALKIALVLALFCSNLASLRAQQPQPSSTSNVNISVPQQQVSAVTDAVPSGGALPQHFEYLLGPGDVLEFGVFGEPQFDGMLDVDSNGNINIPYIEKAISARCRTVNDVRKDATTALSKFIKNPQVKLRVREQHSRKPALVYGAVRSPAQFQMNRPARLLELLSGSFGVTEQASGTIQVFHTEEQLCANPDELIPQTQAATAPQPPASGTDAIGLPFNVYKLSDLKMGKLDANPYIRPGDLVYVAEAPPIYVTGSVTQPASLYLREAMTLSRAMAMVGGPKKDAKVSAVKIYRQKAGAAEPEIIVADFSSIKKNKKPDVPLQPYDVIEVPEEGLGTAGGIKRLLTGLATGGAQGLVNVVPYRIIP